MKILIMQVIPLNYFHPNVEIAVNKTVTEANLFQPGIVSNECSVSQIYDKKQVHRVMWKVEREQYSSLTSGELVRNIKAYLPKCTSMRKDSKNFN